MAPFSDHDDAAYAADAEGPTPAGSPSATPGECLQHQHSMRNRQFNLYASRLRHDSPSTKHDATAKPLSLEMPPAVAAGRVNQEGPGSPSRPLKSPRTRHFDDRSPVAENSDNYEDDTRDLSPSTSSFRFPHHPHPLRLLPVSPAAASSSTSSNIAAVISPRWASLANSPIVRDHRTTSPTGFISTAPTSPRSPTSLHNFPPRTSASRSQSPASASRFLGLNSHPFIPQIPTPDRSSVSTLDSAIAGPPEKKNVRSVSPVLSIAGEVTPTLQSSASEHPSPTTTFPPPNGTMIASVGNFSRPHKPSIRLASRDIPPAARRRPQEPLRIDSSVSTLTSQSTWPGERARGLSGSSGQSSSTFSSVNKRPPHDHPRPVRNATLSKAAGGMASPGLPRPQAPYSRSASAGGNYSHSQHVYNQNNQNSQNNNRPPHPPNAGHPVSNGMREAFPWIAEDRHSQMISSTAQDTQYTGTARSSLAIKTSSWTSLSAHGAGMTIDGALDRTGDYEEYDDGEGLSVDDVMGMYAKGFADSTDAEDSKNSGEEGLTDAEGLQGTKARQPPQPLDTVSANMARNSGAFLHNAGLPPSPPPQDGEFGVEAGSKEQLAVSPVGEEEEEEEEEEAAPRAVLEKRDSAKMLEADELPMSAAQAKADEAGLPTLMIDTTLVAPVTPASGLGVTPVSGRPGTSHTASVFPLTKPDEPEARDRYGFRKQNQYITREQYDAWNGPYTQYIERRRKKWVAYLKDSGLMTENPRRFPQPSVKTKRFIRKGIPPEWRGAAWFYYAGGPSILAKHAGVYDELIQRAAEGEAKSVDIEAIERDLHRTFPDNIAFQFTGEEQRPPMHTDESDEDDVGVKRRPTRRGPFRGDDVTADRAGEPKIVSRLRRVLLAFSIYNPRIGYCQSLNFLAGLLLLFVPTEEQCFWLLNVITRIYLPGTHEMSLEGSKVDLSVLMTALKNSLPHVWAKIGGDLDEPGGLGPGGSGHEHMPPPTPSTMRRMKLPRMGTSSTAVVSSADRLPPITLCMTAWFMSCFIGTLPMETTLRVWDIFFYEGSKTLFRVALAIFKLGEAEIRAVRDPMEMFGIVQSLPRRLLDCNMVMEATFRRRNGFGHISQENIEEKRREQRDALKEARRPSSGLDSDDDAGGGGAVSAAAADDELGATLEVRRKNTLFSRRRDRRPATANA